MRKILFNKYFLITLITLIIMLCCFIHETNIISITHNFVVSSEYQNEVRNLYGNDLIICYFNLILNIIKMNGFDYLIIWSTNIFQLLIPFYVILSLHFIKSNSKIKFIVFESFKYSLCILVSFLSFYIFILLITNGKVSNYINRELFADLLGTDFYKNNIYLYYLIDGIIKFLIVPFMYILNANLIKLTVDNIDKYCFYIIYFYFGLSLLALFLEKFIGNIFMYMNPMVFMASGSYSNISTIALFMSLIMFNLISYIIYFIRRRNI